MLDDPKPNTNPDNDTSAERADECDKTDQTPKSTKRVHGKPEYEKIEEQQDEGPSADPG